MNIDGQKRENIKDEKSIETLKRWTFKLPKNEMNRALGHLCAHIG